MLQKEIDILSMQPFTSQASIGAELHRQAMFTNWDPEAPRPKSRHPKELISSQFHGERKLHPTTMYDLIS